MPDCQVPDPEPERRPFGARDGSGSDRVLAGFTLQAFQIRANDRHAIHPVEAALQYFRARAEVSGDKGHGGCGFEEAEGHYRAGAQRLRLSEIPQLAEQLRELSRLGPLDRAGRKAIAAWAEGSGFVLEEGRFNGFWDSQGRRGGAEHQVYYDPDLGRWFKRLFHCVNSSTLGDYLVRMRLHAVLFPETAYRLDRIHHQLKEQRGGTRGFSASRRGGYEQTAGDQTRDGRPHGFDGLRSCAVDAQGCS